MRTTRLAGVAVRRSAVIATLAGGFLTLNVGSAVAGTDVGSTLAGAPQENFGVNHGYTSVQEVKVPGSPLPIAAPADGVIVSVRVKHGKLSFSSATVSLRIITGSGASVISRSHPRLPELEYPQNAAEATDTIVPKDGNGTPRGVPIATGERVGLATVSGTANGFVGPATGGTVAIFTGSDGGTLPISNTFPDYEQLIQFTIEPDADGDQYGDETQDACIYLPGPTSCTITGTLGPDVIQGTPGNDVIYGLAGNDKIYGNGGNDLIIGGKGKDKLVGGEGNDTLKGKAGTDVCKGGPGTDVAKSCEKVRTVP
jgi:Ca2+-binding RTX toxin-like protein